MASGTITFSTTREVLEGRINWSSSSNGSSANSSNVWGELQVRRNDGYTTTGTWTGADHCPVDPALDFSVDGHGFYLYPAAGSADSRDHVFLDHEERYRPVCCTAGIGETGDEVVLSVRTLYFCPTVCPLLCPGDRLGRNRMTGDRSGANDKG